MFLDQQPTLRVGIDNAPPVPMQMGSPECGDFRGYEVSLLEALAKCLRCTLQYRRALWSVIVGELSTGKLDLVCSAATVTAERAHHVDFCTPHLKLMLAVVVREGTSTDVRWKSSKFGVRIGTTAEAYVVERVSASAQLLKSESNDELYEALVTGLIDALIDDSPIALHFAQVSPGLRHAGALASTIGEYAVVLRKGNTELRERINRVLGDLESNGTLPALRRTWFKTERILIA